MTNLPVPSLAAPVTGTPISQAYLTSQVYNPLYFLLNRPICTVYQVTPQTMPTLASPAPITMDGSSIDTYGGHSNSTNPSRYVAPVPGIYKVWGSFAGGGLSSQTEFIAYIAKNGAEITGSRAADVSNASHAYALATPPVFLSLATGDYVELYGAGDGTGNTHTGLPTSSLSVEFAHA